MDAIRRHLFEWPVYLWIALGIAETVLAALWYSRQTRRRALALLPAPALALAVGLTAYLVETDREQIASALRSIAAAVEDQDVSAAGAYLDANCRSPGPGGTVIDKDDLMGTARRALDRWTVTDVAVSGVQTQVAGANATTQLQTRISFSGPGFVQQPLNMGWRLQWAKREAGWRIVRVEITHPAFLREFTF